MRSRLQAIIDDVSNANESPKFVPHMTIVSIPSPGEIPSLKEPFSEALRQNEGLELKFKSLFIGSSYFISVALSLDQTPPLLKFQKDISAAFHATVGVQDLERPFFPHISLFYGERSREEREGIASSIVEKEVKSDSNDSVKVDGVNGCTPSEIWVMKTDGKVEDWEILETIYI